VIRGGSGLKPRAAPVCASEGSEAWKAREGEHEARSRIYANERIAALSAVVTPRLFLLRVSRRQNVDTGRAQYDEHCKCRASRNPVRCGDCPYGGHRESSDEQNDQKLWSVNHIAISLASVLEILGALRTRRARILQGWPKQRVCFPRFTHLISSRFRRCEVGWHNSILRRTTEAPESRRVEILSGARMKKGGSQWLNELPEKRGARCSRRRPASDRRHRPQRRAEEKRSHDTEESRLSKRGRRVRARRTAILPS
jgi:hypothetical protein